MRALMLAVAITGLPALASAQTGSASGTLVDEPALATTIPADSPAPQQTPEMAQPVASDAQTSPPAAGVAAPGISVSNSGETSSNVSTPNRSSQRDAAGASQGGGVAAPGVSANGSTQSAAATRATIEPGNALERAFVNAARQENQRAAFRRIFLDSQVVLATISADANAAPRLVRLGPAGEACLIFTSDARATQVMGARSPRQTMTGREALQRLRGAHLVIININLDPYLTLDASGVEAFLGADTTPATQTRSAGPSQ